MTRRIGLLGGSFDPIHSGHTDMGRAAESALDLTVLYVIPANVPPHRAEPHASGYHRFAMVSLALRNNAHWRASDIELRHAPPSYTATTLKRFHERGYPPSILFFVIGSDAFAEIAMWKGYPEILDYANFAVVARPGCPLDQLRTRLPQFAARMIPPAQVREQNGPAIILIDAATTDVSSTAIRQRRADGLSITDLVDPRVEQHIERHGLYSLATPGRRASDKKPDAAAGGLHGQS